MLEFAALVPNRETSLSTLLPPSLVTSREAHHAASNPGCVAEENSFFLAFIGCSFGNVTTWTNICIKQDFSLKASPIIKYNRRMQIHQFSNSVQKLPFPFTLTRNVNWRDIAICGSDCDNFVSAQDRKKAQIMNICENLSLLITVLWNTNIWHVSPISLYVLLWLEV